MSSSKSEEKEKSSSTKESSKLEKNIENKHSSNKITLPLSNPKEREMFTSAKESSKSEDEGSIEVDWED